MSREATRVRRAKWGWRERVVLACAHCDGEFVRLQNTRYCSPLCRLLGKVRREGTCWIWQATIDRHGYGTFYLDGRNAPAHQASYRLHGRAIPSGLELDRAENIRRGMRWPSSGASA